MSLSRLLRRSRPIVSMARYHWAQVLTLDNIAYERPLASEDLRRWERDTDHGCYVTECGADVLGYVVCRLYQHHLYLRRIAVRPDQRRGGLGRAMLERVCLLLGPGYPVAVCDLSERYLRDGPFAFLSACGWRPFGCGVGAGPVGEDVYRFVRYAKECTHAEV